ncbi:hypothetical protein [Acinetobacter seifertii]|uniref:hypothetical protein n=1 Tax=Acinetobacter seifertii TaxID=1530123 RepID=UPI003213071B
MATNWNNVLAGINNASDILAILKKVLALLDGKVDLTKIDEIILDLESMKTGVDTALVNVTSALSEFDSESQEAIQQVITAGLMEGFQTEAQLLASRPTEPKKYAKAEDTKVIWFWNKPEGSPDGNYWSKSGLSELEQAKADATQKANTAESNSKKYTDDVYTNTIAGNILLPARIKNTVDVALAARLNRAIKSISLRGDYNSKLIAVAAMSLVNKVFTLILARPDSANEVMSSTTNTKFVARFNGEITFSGVQTLQLTSYGDTTAEISGEIIIDFGQLQQTDALLADYTANERLLDSRAIIDLNAAYPKIKSIDKSIIDGVNRVTRKQGVVFTDDVNALFDINTRINKAIKSISLRGDINSKLITIAYMSFSASTGNFTLGLARPDSLSEQMLAASNTKYVARVNSTITFAGVQTLPIVSYGNTAAQISGEIVIDFGELQQTDALTADYIASTRLFDSRKIIDLNGSYTEMQSVEAAIADVSFATYVNKVGINSLSLVYGTDIKNAKINDAIEKLVFFKPLPKDKYIILKALYYYTAPIFVCQLFIADTPTDQGVLWEWGQGVIDSTTNKVVIWFNQGYMTVNLNYYYTGNGANGAAVVSDNATFQTRGLNQALVEQSVLDSKVFARYENQFVTPPFFHLPTDVLQRSIKLYVNGSIADTDYYLPSSCYWALVNSKYRFVFQIKKMTSPTQDVASGLIVYSGYVEFNATTDVKGTSVVSLNPINGHKFNAQLEIDFSNLAVSVSDVNNSYSPYIQNLTGSTYEKYGLDIFKLRKASRDRWILNSGIVKYPSLKYALDAKEKNLFAVGGNLFKSSLEVPTTKDDLLCINNPPKLLAKNPRKREYDFYYKLAGVTSKIRLDVIDSEDTFYFVNKDVIIKAPHPLKQNLTPVASSSDADFVIYDVSKNAYFSISSFTEVFTKTVLGVVDINFVRLTYDDELFIIAANPNRTMLITKDAQTALRTFTINGSTGTKYSFGDGVTLVKDWCLAHYKDLMFVCDYDTGVNGIRGTTGGQKCYVSTDNGYTFTKCLDFSGADWSNITNASAITSYNRDSAHIHAVSYDPKQNVAWVVTGDGATYLDNASFFYSRDQGKTWTQMRSTAVDNGAKTQMIQALPFENCVAFGSDDSSINGMTVITYDGDRMINEIAKNVITTQQLLAFARSTWSSNNSRVKYISFGKDVQQIGMAGAKSFVVASSNGYNWQIVWEDANDKIHSNVFCYDDSSGKVFISLDGSAEQVWRVVYLDTKYV